MPKSRGSGRFPQWRMLQECRDCPFSQSKEGRFLRFTLGPERMAGIYADLRRGKYFTCHQTTRAEGWNEDSSEYNPVGPELVCAGAIHWAAKRGIKADLVQIMERLEVIHERRSSAIR